MTAGATEALAATILALVDAGDEVVTFEPYYDAYAALIAPCRRRAPHGAAALPRLPARPRRARGRGHRPHADHPRERPAQSDRRRARRRHARAGSCGSPSTTTRSSSPTRSTSTSSFDGAAHADRDAPRRPGAHAHDLVGRQDVHHDRLEDRLGHGARADSSTRVLAVKQFLTFVNGAPFQPAIATGLRLPDAFFGGCRGSRFAPSATCSATGLRAAGFAVSPPSRLVLHRGGCRAPRRTTTARRSAASSPTAPGVVGDPADRVRARPTGRARTRSLVRFAFCKRVECSRRRIPARRGSARLTRLARVTRPADAGRAARSRRSGAARARD